ncbi:peptidase S41 [Zhouia sp. CL16]|nr:S41 family peptidase [Zhouia amylolytica]MCQ0110776.1 peptidase S41 [Zhouia amylolytica]
MQLRLPLFFVCTLSLCFINYAQDNCNCLKALNEVEQLVKKSKSYKLQIKRNKEKEKEFIKWKDHINEQITNDPQRQYFCVGYLQKFISFVNDKHNQIGYQNTNLPTSFPIFNKKINTRNFLSDQFSGIYHAGKEKLVINKENDSIWYGIMLSSNDHKWSNGTIRLKIMKNQKGDLEMFEYFNNGFLLYHKFIEFKNGRIYPTFWNKQDRYFFNKSYKENFEYKSTYNNIDYIAIGSLKRTNKNIIEANQFYEEIIPKLNKEYLIIDLRNNVGGAIAQTEPLLKYIKRSDGLKHIYIIINFKTASAAELVTYKLMGDKRTTVVGENSSGIIAYSYGNKSMVDATNCYDLKATFSTKHTSSKLDQYEYVGITPAFYLNNRTDWVSQIVSLINSNASSK